MKEQEYRYGLLDEKIDKKIQKCEYLIDQLKAQQANTHMGLKELAELSELKKPNDKGSILRAITDINMSWWEKHY